MKPSEPLQEVRGTTGTPEPSQGTLPRPHRSPPTRGRAYGHALKLHHLRALVAIVESGTFSGAALDLGTSQSTLSSAIAELERGLGVRLLDRGRFGAVATDVGEKIVPHVRQLERTLEAIVQEVALTHGDLRGRVRVNAFRSAAARVLPPVMARMLTQHPGVELALHESEPRAGDVAAPLAAGTFDVAITTSLLAGEMLFWELFRDPFVLVVPEGSEASGSEAPLEWVVNQPLIFGSGACWLPIRRHIEAQRPDFRPSFDVSEDSTMVAMVAQGLGVAIMPALAVDALPPGVRQLRLSEPLERRVGVALAPSTLKVPAIRAFLSVLRDLFPRSEIPLLS